MIHQSIRWVKKKFNMVLELRDDKRSIAGGFAIGIFWGFTPLFGLKTVLAFFTAWVTRNNKIAAVAAVSLHDLLVPIYPLYLDLSYHLGTWLLRTENPIRFKKVLLLISHPHGWWHDGTYFVPLLFGAILLAVPFTIASFFAAQWAIERMAIRAARQEAERHDAGEKLL